MPLSGRKDRIGGSPLDRGADAKAGARSTGRCKGRDTMRLKHIVLGAAVASLVGTSALVSQARPRKRFIPLFTYRTGPFANSGIPIANGMHDYFSMLNARDGGIGGSKVVVEECETGYKNEKGVECYEALKSKHPAVITPILHRHYAGADPEGGGRPRSSAVDGLRPLRFGGRQGFPVDLQSAVDAIGMACRSSSATSPARKAASTSSRARPSATSSLMAAMAASRCRCFTRLPRIMASM